ESKTRGRKLLSEDISELSIPLKFKSLENQSIPSLFFSEKSKKSRQIQEAELKRLFYVAITRAKLSIYFWMSNPGSETSNSEYFWNQVLMRAAPNCISYIEN